MLSGGSTIEVNPEGTPSEQVLDRDAVWDGLMTKAQNAVPFVDVISECKVIERLDDGFIREAVLKGETLREQIVLNPKQTVTFKRMGGSPAWSIENRIEEGESGLLLTFTYELVDADGDETAEAAFADEFDTGYVLAMKAVLAHARARL
jgi:hypothetical protein